MPDRKYSGFWRRLLHDQTADAIERAVSRLPHANVTTVPFHFASRKAARGTGEAVEPAAAAVVKGPRANGPEAGSPADSASRTPARPQGTVAIATVTWRQRVQIEGRVRTVRVQPLAGTSTLECVLQDDTGAMSLVFLGRSKIPGIEIGSRIRAEGVAGEHRGRLAIVNPIYQLLTTG
jgi:hypothetical protein